MGDKTTSTGGTTHTETLTAGGSGFSRSPTRMAADNLQMKSIIGGFTMQGPKTVRYIDFDSTAVFNSLAELYKFSFLRKWKALSKVVSPHTRGINDPMDYLARVYISHWLIDVYVSIRDACLLHECVEVSDFYDKILSVQSNHYDCFLAALLQSIKPTHIKGYFEDSLYIPVLAQAYNWNSRDKNYFQIRNFAYNTRLFKAFISVMKTPASGWLTATPSNDPLGSPSWLFDWHEEQAYAWFPEEGNYNQDDVALAFIIGVPCTPPLAIRDKDIPQQFPGNDPIELEPAKLRRKTSKRFRANIEVRTAEACELSYHEQMEYSVTRPVAPPQGAETDTESLALTQIPRPGAPRTETVQVPQNVKFRINCFRIIDFLYFAHVLNKVEINMRTAAHKILTFKARS